MPTIALITVDQPTKIIRYGTLNNSSDFSIGKVYIDVNIDVDGKILSAKVIDSTASHGDTVMHLILR